MEHRLSGQVGDGVWHRESCSDTLHLQTRSPVAPPSEANGEGQDSEWLCQVCQGTDQVGGDRDGRPTDVQEGSQSMQEDSEGGRSSIPHYHRKVRSCSSMCESSTDSWCPGGQGICKRDSALSEGGQPARRPAYSPEWPSLVDTGQAANYCEIHSNEGLMAHTSASGPWHQTTTVHGEASHHMRRLHIETASTPPHTWCTGQQSCHDRVHMRQESRDDMLPDPARSQQLWQPYWMPTPWRRDPPGNGRENRKAWGDLAPGHGGWTDLVWTMEE